MLGPSLMSFCYFKKSGEDYSPVSCRAPGSADNNGLLFKFITFTEDIFKNRDFRVTGDRKLINIWTMRYFQLFVMKLFSLDKPRRHAGLVHFAL